MSSIPGIEDPFPETAHSGGTALLEREEVQNVEPGDQRKNHGVCPHRQARASPMR